MKRDVENAADARKPGDAKEDRPGRSLVTSMKGGSGIHLNPAHKGSLHTALGVPQGKPIPGSALSKAIASGSPNVKRKAVFAKNAKGFRH